jgi:hypothetical protein
MTGCGAADARKLDQCECDLPPGHPPPHRCDDCGRTWHEPRKIGTVRDVKGAGRPASSDRR